MKQPEAETKPMQVVEQTTKTTEEVTTEIVSEVTETSHEEQVQVSHTFIFSFYCLQIISNSN